MEHNTKAKTEFKRGTFQITLDSKGEEPVQIEAGSWRGVDHIGLRQLFRGNDGKLYYGKQGFNCPVDDLPHLVVALLECFNQATGAVLSVHGGDESQEEALSELTEMVVNEEIQGKPEQVYTWSRSA